MREKKKEKVHGYEVDIPWLSKSLFIVGSYKNICGGCDSIQPYSLIWPRIVSYVKDGDHCLFEGALVSSSYGSIGRASEEYGDDFVFAFMDTPIEKCIERIKERRKGTSREGKPFKEDIVRTKFKYIANTIEKVKEFKRRYVIIDHKRAVPQLLGLLRKEEDAS